MACTSRPLAASGFGEAMDEKELVKRRIEELAERAVSQNYPTHTSFLSSDELSLLDELAKEKRANALAHKVGEATYFVYGGSPYAERAVIFFLPDYLTSEDELASEETGRTVMALHIEGKKAQYAEELSHRDYLGALMSLGYERDQFGDIFVEGKEAYVFLFSSIAEEVKKNLLSVRRTYVKTTLLAPLACPFAPKKEEKEVNVASPRLDSLLAEIYHLSREESQNLIAGGFALVDGLVKEETSFLPKEGSKISLKGYGKFEYLGMGKLSRKGRQFVKVNIYL
jgi:RNA-binding protein YlmH